MSSGPEDAHATGDIGRTLMLAANKLYVAIDKARRGHRGLTVDIAGTVNDVLKGSGWRLVEWNEPGPKNQ